MQKADQIKISESALVERARRLNHDQAIADQPPDD
jgi:hypothetical protein